jgi:hypothetical protein
MIDMLWSSRLSGIRKENSGPTNGAESRNERFEGISHVDVVRVFRAIVFTHIMVIRIHRFRDLTRVPKNRGVFLKNHLGSSACQSK